MLAGYLAATESSADPAAALTAALAWGAGAASLPGSRMPRPSDLHPEGVRIHPALDRDRPLEEVAVAPTTAATPVVATPGAPAPTHAAQRSTPTTEGPVR
jgi:1-phosphofructokinase